MTESESFFQIVLNAAKNLFGSQKGKKIDNHMPGAYSIGHIHVRYFAIVQYNTVLLLQERGRRQRKPS